MMLRIAHYWPTSTAEALMREVRLVAVQFAWFNETWRSAVGVEPPPGD
jgi:hypothetical protein